MNCGTYNGLIAGKCCRVSCMKEFRLLFSPIKPSIWKYKFIAGYFRVTETTDEEVTSESECEENETR